MERRKGRSGWGTERERILKLDESCISNPKSEISNWTGNLPGTERGPVQSGILDFGFEMQDSFNLKISSRV